MRRMRGIMRWRRIRASGWHDEYWLVMNGSKDPVTL